MRITLSLYLDTRRAEGGKPVNVMVLITRGGKSAMLPVGLKISPEVWDRRTKTVLKCPQKAFFDKVISDKYYAVQEALNKLAEEDRGLLDRTPIVEVKNIVARMLDGDGGNAGRHLLRDCFRGLAEKKAGSRRSSFAATWRMICLYSSRAGSMRMEDVSLEWVEGFEAFMAVRGLSANTRWLYLCVLRSVFNSALDDGVISADVFRKFRIRKEPTVKRSLTAGEVRAFAALPVNGRNRVYRDVAMLSFYLIGINMTDLLQLTYDNVQNGRIVYVRNKTKKVYSIKIEPEAQAIFDRYRGERYLLDILEKNPRVYTFIKNIDWNLKRMGTTVIDGGGMKRTVPFFNKMSTYYMRHSWATIAYNDCNVPVDVISQALGHSMGNKVTMVYINTDSRRVDEANRKVIDFVNNS